MNRAVGMVGLVLLIASVASAQPAPPAERDQITQVSVINALMLGRYDGLLTIQKLLQLGDFGLGTVDHLDGELVVLDGQAYQIKASGEVVEVDDHETTPFAIVTPFDKDGEFACPAVGSLVELESRLDQQIAGPDLFIAIRLDAEFDALTVRSVPRQEPPYKLLADVSQQQSVWSYEQVKGTLVGIRCPKWVTGLNVPGYHWHFLSSDRQKGGHVLDCRIQAGGAIAYDACDAWLIRLDTTAPADGKDLSQDLSDDLEQVEKLRSAEPKQ